MAQAEFTASNWGRADEARWRALWDHEIGELPSHRESRFWLASGLLLPVWDRLPAENMRVRRLTSDDGISRSSGACSTPSRSGPCAPGSASTAVPP